MEPVQHERRRDKDRLLVVHIAHRPDTDRFAESRHTRCLGGRNVHVEVAVVAADRGSGNPVEQ